MFDPDTSNRPTAASCLSYGSLNEERSLPCIATRVDEERDPGGS
jgi:hypothetical protein